MRNNESRVVEAFMLFNQDVKNTIQCKRCLYPYNLTTRSPWNICLNRHNICLNCKKTYLKKIKTCHTCHV